MPRNMSFQLTTNQVRARTKTVTRRFGWAFLKPGDVVMAVVKTLGIRRGQLIERLGPIRVVSTRWEPLDAITPEELQLEGLPGMDPARYVAMMLRGRGVVPDIPVNRIEFEYLDLDY